MTLDCNNVTLNATVDCENPWAPACTSKNHFQLPGLWNFTYNIYTRCPTDDRLFRHANGTHLQALTKDACEHIAGSWLNWYSGSVIWVRLTTWKFPLFQLIAQFPCPPLGLATQFFVMAHLLGDPIDTIKNLLRKLSKCQSRAESWKASEPLVIGDIRLEGKVPDKTEAEKAFRKRLQRDRWQKALGILTESYDEWGKGDEGEEMLFGLLNEAREAEKLREGEEARKNAGIQVEESAPLTASLQALILEIADALAADRATKHLPIWIALGCFIGAITVAMTRTMAVVDDEVFNKTIFISLEMHGVAFSSGFFWLIPAVFLGSIIGVSQTEERIRRILRRFHNDLERIGSLGRGRPSPAWLEGEDKARVFCGGVYSWRPIDWHGEAVKLPSLQQSRPASGLGPPPRIETLPFERSGRSESHHRLLAAQVQPVQPNNDNASDDIPPKPPKQRTMHRIKKLWASQMFWSIIIVAVPTITGTLLSSRVPPEGWNCRVIGEFGRFAVWLLSAQLDYALDYRIGLSEDIDYGIHCSVFGTIPWWRHQKRNKLFWVMYAKDVICTLATLLFLVLAVSGSFNACNCWMSPDTGLILPQRPDINGLLQYRLHHEYPLYIYLGMGIELIIVPLIIWRKYPDAMRVFVQRDDGESNWRGYWKIATPLAKWSGIVKSNVLFWKRSNIRSYSNNVRDTDSRPADATQLHRLNPANY